MRDPLEVTDADLSRSFAAMNEVEARKAQAEIEVTPAMIRAGGLALEDGYLGNGKYALTDDVIALAFRAMLREANLSLRP